MKDKTQIKMLSKQGAYRGLMNPNESLWLLDVAYSLFPNPSDSIVGRFFLMSPIDEFIVSRDLCTSSPRRRIFFNFKTNPNVDINDDFEPRIHSDCKTCVRKHWDACFIWTTSVIRFFFFTDIGQTFGKHTCCAAKSSKIA
jgi:hypothetical protein